MSLEKYFNNQLNIKDIGLDQPEKKEKQENLLEAIPQDLWKVLEEKVMPGYLKRGLQYKFVAIASHMPIIDAEFDWENTIKKTGLLSYDKNVGGLWKSMLDMNLQANGASSDNCQFFAHLKMMGIKDCKNENDLIKDIDKGFWRSFDNLKNKPALSGIDFVPFFKEAFNLKMVKPDEEFNIDNEILKSWTEKAKERLGLWKYIAALAILRLMKPELTPRLDEKEVKEIKSWLGSVIADIEPDIGKVLEAEDLDRVDKSQERVKRLEDVFAVACYLKILQADKVEVNENSQIEIDKKIELDKKENPMPIKRKF